MSRINLFIVFCLSFFMVGTASATTYSFESGTFYPRYYEAGGTASQYEFRSVFDLSALTLEINAAGESAHLTGDFSGILQNRSGDTVGSSTGSLDLTFSGLNFNPTVGDDNIIALGMQGTSTSSGTYSFALDFDNRPLEAETINVFGGFANKGANHPKFGDLAGTPFNFILRDNGQFDVWVKSLEGTNFTLFNDPFQLHGDIHGNAEVPEPTTVALLAAGLIGGAARKKRLKTQ